MSPLASSQSRPVLHASRAICHTVDVVNICPIGVTDTIRAHRLIKGPAYIARPAQIKLKDNSHKKSAEWTTAIITYANNKDGKIT